MELYKASTGDSSSVLAVIGAGPKAAALAAKAHVLRTLRSSGVNVATGDVQVLIIEQNELAANWGGEFGFTTGQGPLRTPPEKDLGFPYRSKYGGEVDMLMWRYSWHAHLISLTSYSDWVDRGRQQPRHEKWAQYIRWAIKLSEAQIVTGTARRVIPENGKLKIDVHHSGQDQTIEANGIVFTGPGEPIPIRPDVSSPSLLIFDGRNYWKGIGLFEGMERGKVALIGGGETAASIALSLLDKAPKLDIEIVNRQGAIFTRGESYRENKPFSNPDDWADLDEIQRAEFIKRTDRGVFSVEAQRKLDRADNVTTITGHVTNLEEEGGKVIVQMEREGTAKSEIYDRVIVALGFDPWYPLQMFPEAIRPSTESESLKRLQLSVDEFLRIPFDLAPGINVHMPMVAGLRQGPGFPNLSCLGHLSDRILMHYAPPLA